MAGDRLEVRVGTEQLCVVSHRDDRDQAVGKLARRVPCAAAEPIQVGGAFVVAWTVDVEEVLAVKEPAQPFAIRGVASPGQDLHHDHVGRSQGGIVLEGGLQAKVSRTAE